MSAPFETLTKPRVWLPLDTRMLGDEHKMPYLVLGDKYARAVLVGVKAQPVTYPLAVEEDVASLLCEVDGVFLTGSPANVHPSHFDEEVSDPSLPLDADRDSLTLSLVRACVSEGVPLFGVCRGFQEINVALGGSLHQQVQNVAGMMDHREAEGTPEQQYALAHEIRFADDSIFVKWAGSNVTQVNSLHGQGVNRLAQGLKAHAFAPDGLIEAFEVLEAKTFAYAVQWHPEWRCWENPFNAAMLAAFGEACLSRRRARTA